VKRVSWSSSSIKAGCLKITLRILPQNGTVFSNQSHRCLAMITIYTSQPLKKFKCFFHGYNLIFECAINLLTPEPENFQNTCVVEETSPELLLARINNDY
jgi:hypothetical protein